MAKCYSKLKAKDTYFWVEKTIDLVKENMDMSKEKEH